MASYVRFDRFVDKRNIGCVLGEPRIVTKEWLALITPQSRSRTGFPSTDDIVSKLVRCESAVSTHSCYPLLIPGGSYTPDWDADNYVRIRRDDSISRFQHHQHVS